MHPRASRACSDRRPCPRKSAGPGPPESQRESGKGEHSSCGLLVPWRVVHDSQTCSNSKACRIGRAVCAGCFFVTAVFVGLPRLHPASIDLFPSLIQFRATVMALRLEAMVSERRRTFIQSFFPSFEAWHWRRTASYWTFGRKFSSIGKRPRTQPKLEQNQLGVIGRRSASATFNPRISHRFQQYSK